MEEKKFVQKVKKENIKNNTLNTNTPYRVKDARFITKIQYDDNPITDSEIDKIVDEAAEEVAQEKQTQEATAEEVTGEKQQSTAEAENTKPKQETTEQNNNELAPTEIPQEEFDPEDLENSPEEMESEEESEEENQENQENQNQKDKNERNNETDQNNQSQDEVTKKNPNQNDDENVADEALKNSQDKNIAEQAKQNGEGVQNQGNQNPNNAQSQGNGQNQNSSQTQDRMQQRQNEKNKIEGDKKARESQKNKPNSNPYNKEQQKTGGLKKPDGEKKPAAPVAGKGSGAKKPTNPLNKLGGDAPKKLSIKELIKKKIKEHLPLVFICAPFIIVGCIAVFGLMFTAIFGVDPTPNGAYYEDTTPTEEISKDANIVTIKYDDGTTKDYEEKEYYAGVIYAFLKDDIDTYKKDNFDIANMYEILTINIAYTLIHDNPDTLTADDDTPMHQYINYSEYSFCSTKGCYEITDENDKVFYVDEELSKNYSSDEITNTIPALSDDDKNSILESIKGGMLFVGISVTNKSNGKTFDDDFKSDLYDYIKDGYETEDILKKLKINFEIEDDEYYDEDEEDDED